MKKILKTLPLLLLIAVIMTLSFSFHSLAADHKHDTEKKTTRATLTKDGYVTYKCQKCDYTEKRVIPKIGTVKLKKTKFVFNGEDVHPEIIVLDSNGDPIDQYDYIFRWRHYYKIGTYTCSVEFRDLYKGEVTLTYKIVSPVKTPKLKATSSTSKGAKIEWEKQKAASGYTVYRKSGDSGWKKLGSTKNTYYIDPTAVYNKTYKYTVVAYYKPKSGGGVKSGYDKKGITLKMKKVVTPSAPSVSSKSLCANIKIKEVKGATSYKIYKATSKNGEYKLIHTTKKGVLSYTDKNVKINKTYFYKIRAYVGSKASALSSYDKVFIKLDTPKVGTAINVDRTTVNFTWGKVTGADYYIIYKNYPVLDEKWIKVATVKSGNELSYKGNIDKLTRFTIVAYKKLSSKTTLKSSMSETIGVYPMNKPKIEIKPNAIDNAAYVYFDTYDQSYYKLYRKEGRNGKWQVIENKHVNSANHYHNLKMDTTYYFAVRLYHKSGSENVYGPVSDIVSVTLHYNPDIEVILPSSKTKTGSAIPVTIKNNSSSALKVNVAAYIKNEDFTRSGDIYIFDPYGEYARESDYIVIEPYSSATVNFLANTNIYGKTPAYNPKCSIIFKFIHNGVDFVSSYSNYYGKSFYLNKE